jgi:hypothetical protein
VADFLVLNDCGVYATAGLNAPREQYANIEQPKIDQTSLRHPKTPLA